MCLAVAKVAINLTAFCYTIGMEDGSKIKLRRISESSELKRILRRNIKLTKENNQLLKKLQRQNLISLWLKIIWFVILVGLPFIAYYILEPSFSDFYNLLDSYEIPLINNGVDSLPKSIR